MKKGDILTFSYNYAGITPVFLRVTDISRGLVSTEVLSHKVVEHDGYGQNGKCIPDETQVMRKNTKRNKVMSDSHGEFLKMEFGHHAYVWSGEPREFCTD